MKYQKVEILKKESEKKTKKNRKKQTNGDFEESGKAKRMERKKNEDCDEKREKK